MVMSLFFSIRITLDNIIVNFVCNYFLVNIFVLMFFNSTLIFARVFYS